MNVFLITSPFQVLNALEAIHRFAFTDNHLIVLEIGLFTRAQYEKLIDRPHWTKVRYFELYKNRRPDDRDFAIDAPVNIYERLQELYLAYEQLLRRTRLDRLARSLGPVDNLVLGSYRSDYDLHFRHFANRVKCGAVYVLDVGTNTLDFERRAPGTRAEALAPATGNLGAGKRLKRFLRTRFVDWDKTGYRSVTFFTCYSPDDNTSRCIRNEFKYLKSLIGEASNSNDVWFLGESLVEDALLSRDAYMQLLRRIRRYFKNADFIYVPHPRELKGQAELVQKELNCRIQRFDVPIEFALVNKTGARPQCIASFLSSALVNCSVIFGGKVDIKSFYIPVQHLLKGSEMVERFYTHFKSGRSGKIEVVADY